MRDVRERAAVHERGLALERLHEVRLDRILEDDGHRARGLDPLGGDRLALVRLADGDAPEALAEVGEIARDGDESHDLARGRDVEPGLARSAVRPPAEARHDVPEVPVVHVHAAAPGDRERVDPRLVPVVQVRVDERREEVVRRRDRVQVAGEVQVEVLHRDDLGVAAAGGAALHAEHRPERRLTQAEHRLPAEGAESLRQGDGCRRLALTRRRRRDRRDVHELRVRPVAEPVDDREIDLRLVAPVRLDLVGLEADVLGDVEDRAKRRGLRDLQAGRHLRLHRSPSSNGSRPPLRAPRRACPCGSARARTARSGRVSCRWPRAPRA